MPIEFAPPSPVLQGFQIAPPQSVDPLQTLAQMGQLRTQNLQQQNAALQLQEQQQKLESNKALLAAMVGGGNFEDVYKRASESGKVLPADLISLQEHNNKVLQEKATYDEAQRKLISGDSDRYAAMLNGVKSQEDLDAANARADQEQIHPRVTRLRQFTDPEHVNAFTSTLGMYSDVLKRQETAVGIGQKKAEQAQSEAQTTEANQKIAAGERAAAIAEVEAATDPATGVPSPADWAAIQQRHPKVQLPQGTPTKDTVAAFVRSGVPAEKLPEFDLNTMKAKLGLLGNTEFDQFLLKYSQGLNKTPQTLSPAEFNKGLQQYAELKQDPQMRTLAIGMKGLQEQMLKAQMASAPTPQSNDMFARMLLNHELTPDMLGELKSGRMAAAPQIYARAKEIDPTFNPAKIETEYKTMQNTEKAFATGDKGDMVRSFDNLMRHTGYLDQARKALFQSDLPTLRAIANTLGIQAGGSAATVYDTIADFVASEAGKAFLPSGGGEAERAKNYSHFQRNLGDKQISDNIRALMDLADSQRQGLERQYDRGTFGRGSQKGQLFSEDALATRDRLMGRKPQQGAGKITVKAGDGSLHPFDTEEQAQRFEASVKAAGGTTTRQ